MFIDRFASNAKDWNAETPLITGGDFKTAGINNTVNSVLLVVGDDAVFSNRLDSLCGAYINQFHVGPIKRVEIKVIKRRAFAELVVIRLEFLCDIRIFYGIVNQPSDLFHGFEISNL